MFSADLSWVDEKSQRVGERREKERLKKVSSTTTTSTRKTTNRTSSTSDETSRIESNILDLPMRRFRAGGLSRRNSMVKIRRESTTSSTNSFPATVVNSNDLPVSGFRVLQSETTVIYSRSSPQHIRTIHGCISKTLTKYKSSLGDLS